MEQPPTHHVMYLYDERSHRLEVDMFIDTKTQAELESEDFVIRNLARSVVKATFKQVSQRKFGDIFKSWYHVDEMTWDKLTITSLS